MGADNMMAMKFRVKDRNNQLKNFFEAMFEEDIDYGDDETKLPKHPWAKQWADLYRLGEFISYYSKKDLNDCLNQRMLNRDCLFSLVVVEPDVYDIAMTYSGKPTSSDLEDVLWFFQPFMVEDQPCNHIAHYSCDLSDYSTAYVMHDGFIKFSGSIGNREYNRDFIRGVNNPDCEEVQWGEPITRWDISQKPVEEPNWWSHDENRYFDFSKLEAVVVSNLVWEGVK